jgi:hypothetical protein
LQAEPTYAQFSQQWSRLPVYFSAVGMLLQLIDFKRFILPSPEGAASGCKPLWTTKVVLSGHSPQSYPQKLWIMNKLAW